MTQHVFYLVIAFLEYTFACLLLCNPFPKKLATASGTLFFVFAVVTARQVVLNESSCGCLGTVEIAPIWMFLFDSFACFAFVWFARKLPAAGQPKHFEGWRFRVAIAGIAIAFLICRTSLGNWRAVRDMFSDYSVAESLPYRQDDFVKLEPALWRGSPFPLLEYLEDSPPEGDEGKILLYRKNCEHCRKLIDSILEKPQSDSDRIVLFVEIDGAGTPAYLQRAATESNNSFFTTSLQRNS